MYYPSQLLEDSIDLTGLLGSDFRDMLLLTGQSVEIHKLLVFQNRGSSTDCTFSFVKRCGGFY